MPSLVKHQLEHQNDLPCGCYICKGLEKGQNLPEKCDYVFPDLNLACGHQDFDEPSMRAHKNKMGHFVFSRKNEPRFQCGKCLRYFNYQNHLLGHLCVLTYVVKEMQNNQ